VLHGYLEMERIGTLNSFNRRAGTWRISLEREL